MNDEGAIMGNVAYLHVQAHPHLLGTIISSNINKCFCHAVKVQSPGELQSMSNYKLPASSGSQARSI